MGELKSNLPSNSRALEKTGNSVGGHETTAVFGHNSAESLSIPSKAESAKPMA